MTKKKNDSPAYMLLKHVWDNNSEQSGHSWERSNHSMYMALSLAIGSGMTFDLDDWHRFADDFGYGHWCGTPDDRFYTHAVAALNLSACKAYEHANSMSPLIADDVEVPGSDYMHGGGRRKRERLCVGCSVTWRGIRYDVTSISVKDGVTCATAVTYKEREQDERGYTIGRQKIATRIRIIGEAIAEERKRVRLWQKINAALTKDNHVELCKRLGIDPKNVKRDYVYMVSTEILEQVVASLKGKTP
jgi:putative ubiquitin-RnfH superfamily antitoxin RatB of RatAB toxin-antitoxin module